MSVCATLAWAAPSSDATSPVPALAAKAAALRLVASQGVGRLGLLLAADERRAAAPLLEIKPTAKARLVERSLGQSISFVDVNGSDGLVAFWNAFDDDYIMSQWRLTGQIWRLARLGALLGSDLAGAPATGRADHLDWPRHGATVARALAAQNAEGIDRLKAAMQGGRLPALLEDNARQARAWDELARRLAINQAMLAGMEHQDGYGRYPVQIGAALRTGKHNGLEPAFAAFLERLPPAARLSLRPVMVVETKTAHAFVVQSPIKPAFVIVADFDDTQRPPALRQFRTVPLL